jgi:hypothetical protein
MLCCSISFEMFDPKSSQALPKSKEAKAKFLYVLFKDSGPFDLLIASSGGIWADMSLFRAHEE